MRRRGVAGGGVAGEYGEEGKEGRGGDREDGGKNNYRNLHLQLPRVRSLVACPINSKTGFSNNESLERLVVQRGTDQWQALIYTEYNKERGHA
jgi:hypothetical protein